MLAGIRTGKRKRKRPESGEGGGKGGPSPSAAATGGGPSASASASASVPPSSSANLSAAAELRRQLLGGGAPRPSSSAASSSASAPASAGGGAGASADGKLGNEDVVARLERRGRISSTVVGEGGGDDGQRGDDNVVVLTGAAAASSSRPQYQKEDYRHGSRKGKVSKKDLPSSADMTIEQMVAEEKAGKTMSMDEAYARNVARVGSRYKNSDFSQGVPGASTGADEEDYSGVEGGADMTMFRSPSDRLTAAAAAQRERARQVAVHDAQESATARCWWWMESSSFERHRLLSLGDHVSLVLCPSHLALTRGHCFLVPVKHAEAFVSAEDEVWDEVQRFRTSVRKMFAKQGRGVLFCETVLPNKGFWQARMDVLPVPKRVEQDAAIYFKSALTEQAEEWGTHTKLLSTRDKGLRRTIPKKFPYFNVEWDGGGFAQIIESASFPKDFGLDTIAGMMDLDPVRFNRKKKAADSDRAEVLDFCAKFKEFDWTLELD